MKNDINKSEGVFKDLAESLEVDIDTNELWGAVESQLPVKRKRRGGVFWWWMAAAILLGVGVLKMTNDTIEINEAKNTKSLIVKNEASYEENNIIEKKKEVNATKVGGSKAQKDQSNKKSFENKKINSPNNASIREQDHLEGVEEVQRKISTGSESGLRTASGKSELYDEFQEIYVSNLVLPQLENKKSKGIEIDHNRGDILANLIIPNQKNSNWFIAFASGVNRNWSRVGMNDVEIVDSRFDLERDLYGVTTELMLGIQKGKWSFALGGSHTLQTAEFRQKEIVVQQEEVTGTTSTIILPTGTKMDVQGNVLKTTINRYDIQWHRVHQEVDVQLELGRYLLSYGRWSLTAYVGLGYNIWAKHKGYYFEPGKRSITKINSEMSSPYRKKGGLKYNGAFSFNYHLGKIQLGLAPYIKYSNYSILENTYYTIKNAQYGLQFRMIYRP